jgi:RNA polymerase sigma-70 factor (ECF subfamily)
MVEIDPVRNFEEIVLPHLAAAYNVARWILGNEPDTEDVVQEAVLRAFRSFATFRGENACAWLLAVVRNAAYTFLQRGRSRGQETEFDDEQHGDAAAVEPNPEDLFVSSVQRRSLNEAVQALPLEFREVFVLREAEGLAYKEIAQVLEIPIGTVMSRLSRARRRLQDTLRGADQAECAR